MAKKILKKKATVKPSLSSLTDPVVESAHEVWLAGMGAFALAQKEGGKVVEQGSKLFEKLVAEGARLEKQSSEAMGEGAGEVRGRLATARAEVEKKVEQARASVNDRWDRLEGVFEDRVTRVLGRLGVPTAEDVQSLTRRIEALSRKLARLDVVSAEDAFEASTGATAAYHLLPKGEAWTVRLEGSEEDLSVHDTKAEALDSARGVAQAHEPSRLVVHRADGTIQTSYSYGDAN